jgi:hypothetical protein
MNYLDLMNLSPLLLAKYPWLAREHSKYPLHPVIQSAMDGKGFKLANPETLLLEWPHTSEDGLRIAYTRTVAHGKSNRQTVTAIGRYLTRHFCSAKANELRDLAVLFNQDEHIACEFTERSVEAYVHAVQLGPASCMKWDHWHSGQTHPYEVYAPAYGWHMAVEKQSGVIWGRCLCLEHNNRKLFVRSYRNNPESQAYSGTSTLLEAWLINQGYTRVSIWPAGSKLALIYDAQDRVLTPYLDGELKRITIFNGEIKIDYEGEFCCNQTDGSSEEEENREYCNGCDESYNEDCMNSVDPDGNQRYCDGCVSDGYTYAYSRHGYQCYIHNDHRIYLGDEAYDERYLAHYDIVLIDAGNREGDYAKQDQTVTDALSMTWHVDDVDEWVVFLSEGAHADKYFPIDRTWVCAGSDIRFSDEDASITANGCTYDAAWANANLQGQLIAEDLSQALPVDGLKAVCEAEVSHD